MKKQLNYADIIKEVLILTGAVAIIAAAVYFFLVPSHTSVSSISSDHWLHHLRTRVWRKNGLHQHRFAFISRII